MATVKSADRDCRLQALQVAGASQNATMDMCCFAWQGRTLTLQPWTCVVLRGKAAHHGHVLFCVAWSRDAYAVAGPAGPQGPAGANTLCQQNLKGQQAH